MYRGSTANFNIIIPDDGIDVDKILVTFSQDNEIVFEKDETDMTRTDRRVFSFTLTQEEVNAFEPNQKLVIQTRLKSGNEVFVSDRREVSVNDVLNDEVL